MNITPEVFDKKCPHCGVTIEKQLKTQAFETGYGYREHGVFMCNFCEGDIEFRFEWGVVWSEITKVEEQLPDRSVTEQRTTVETKCKKCDGCGKIANTDDQEPWTVWVGLPLHSATAVLAGLVRPITCPECGGTGKQAHETDLLDELSGMSDQEYQSHQERKDAAQ